jgi:GcrA cell cycle regulator
MATLWTDERTEQLKTLWADGWSARQVAIDLGCFQHLGDDGRNAVISKVHRMKLPQPIGKEVCSRNKRQRQEPRPRVRPLGLHPQRRTSSNYDILANIAIAASEPGIPEKLKGEEPDGTGIQIADLLDNSCRWPRGDPKTLNFEFCGRRALPGLPYCARHCRLAYAPTQSRNRTDDALST